MRHDNTITEEAINLLGRAVSCFKTAFFRTAGVRHLKCSTPECVQIVYMSSQVEEEFMERDVLQVTKSPSHQGIVQCQLKRAATNKHVAITMIMPPRKMSIQGVAILALSG